MRIGLDLRWLEQAYRNSPRGAVGGIGIFIRNLWLGLARVFPEIEYVAIVSRGEKPEALLKLIEFAPKHQILPIGLSGLLCIPSLEHRGNYISVFRLLEAELITSIWLKQINLDIFHLLDQTAPPRWVPFPTVATVYDMIGLKNNWLRYIHFMCLERASQLVPISLTTQSDLVKRFPNKTEVFPVVYPGIDIDIFKHPVFSLNQLRYHFFIDREYFIHVGVLTERKNITGLIKAVKRVIDQRKRNILLLCVGPYQVNPSARQRVLDLAYQSGIENNVLILGDVDALELSSLYHHALGLVFPSFEEGFGLPALECLASGTPCVVSKTTSLPEVVGDFGILVNPYDVTDIADGMLKLLDDSTYRSKIKEQGPSWANRFSLESMAVNYMKLYQGLV